MAERFSKKVNPETGEVVIVERDEQGRVVDMRPDPGFWGAQNAAFMDRVARIAEGHGLKGEDDLDRARLWAQRRQYMDDYEAAYPLGTMMGDAIGTLANVPATVASMYPQTRAGQFLAGIGASIYDEATTNNPLREAGDYLDAATNAALFDTGAAYLGRAVHGLERLGGVVKKRGWQALFRNTLSEAGQDLNARGYHITNVADLVPEDDPLRGPLEQMAKGNQSSALPSAEVKRRTQANELKLANRLREAMGLPTSNNSIRQADLWDAELRLNKEYERLKAELPENVELSHTMAELMRSGDGYRLAEKAGLLSYKDVRRYFAELDEFQRTGAGAMPDPPTITRDEFFNVRSNMTKLADDVQDVNVTRDIFNHIDEMDRSVSAQMGGNDQWLDDYARAREQWEVFFTASRPGVIQDDRVSPLRLARAMTSESNFGRRALYGDAEEFTNAETGELAADVAALARSEFGNSQTTDRASWLKFLGAVADDPLYALNTLGTRFAVDEALKQQDAGRNIPSMLNTVLRGPGTVNYDDGTLVGQMMRAGIGPGRAGTGNVVPGMANAAARSTEGGVFDLFLPDAGVRDMALGVFEGREDDRPQ